MLGYLGSKLIHWSAIESLSEMSACMVNQWTQIIAILVAIKKSNRLNSSKLLMNRNGRSSESDSSIVLNILHSN